MGQATVDLPDPLDVPPAPATLSGTDDLLAKLAGDEIDRLIAEVESERSVTTSAPASVAPATAVEAAVPAPAAPVAPAPVPPTAAPKTATALDADLEAQLDSLLNALQEGNVDPAPAATPVVDSPAALIETTPEPEPAPAPVAAAPPVAAPVPAAAPVVAPAPAVAAPVAPVPAPVAVPVAVAPVSSPAPAAPEAHEPVMSAAERDALALSDLADATDAAIEQDAAEAEARKSSKLAPLVRILELVNAPINSMSDTVRDTLGKVAILTLANSVAVLLYVLLFRH